MEIVSLEEQIEMQQNNLRVLQARITELGKEVKPDKE